jgi:UDP-N-acetylglucosamine:LPS N-acetylglucosamine transferase
MERFNSSSPRDKKKILIFSCKGGHGHVSASLAIQEILRGKYDFQEVFPIEELHSLFEYSGESFYNSLLKNDWIRFTNVMSNQLAPLWFQARRKGIEALIQKYMQKEKPDLVLSLIPYINYPASEAARKSRVPYLLVTTDNDLSIWAIGLENLKHRECKVTIGRDHDLTRGLLTYLGIPSENIETIGLPIHPQFLQQKNTKLLKNEFNIPKHRQVVMLMMGGAGGKKCFEYAKTLEEMNLPLHVIVCTGNNTSLYEKMQSLAAAQKNTSFSIFKFSHRIADLMQVSNLLITKPGPGTINEAMVKRLPILVDNTQATLAWEKVNRDFVVQAGIGQMLHRIEDVKRWVPKYLYEEETRHQVDWNYQTLKTPAFATDIEKVIRSMLDPVACAALPSAKAWSQI